MRVFVIDNGAGKPIEWTESEYRLYLAMRGYTDIQIESRIAELAALETTRALKSLKAGTSG